MSENNFRCHSSGASHLLFETMSLTGLELCQVGKLAGQQAPGLRQSSPISTIIGMTSMDHCVLLFNMESGDRNSDLHKHEALLTEPSPHSQGSIFVTSESIILGIDSQ